MKGNNQMMTNLLGYLTRQKIEKLQAQIDIVYEVYHMFDWPPHLSRKLKRALNKLQKEKERLENER